MDKIILFDLDGTLTDSGEGIINSVEFAYQHYGIPAPSREILKTFIGPPLHLSFAQHGIPEEKAQEAVEVFRLRYNPIGKFENYPYPGIHDLLGRLKKKGYRLFVATSKPEQLALEVLEHFGLKDFFELICGASEDTSRTTKDEVIDYLLKNFGENHPMMMVGDTKFDVLGARKHGINTIGVTWGYGSEAELKEAGAIAIAHSMEELEEKLDENM